MNPAPIASIVMGAMLCMSFVCPCAGEERRPLTTAESAFLKKATAAAALETKIASLAVRQGGTTAIKAYAGMLMQDHQRMSIEMKDLTASEFVPTAVVMSPEDAGVLRRLGECGIAEFDTICMEELTRSHCVVLASFEKQATEGTNVNLKVFVTKTIRLLRAHHDMAVELTAK